MFLKILRIIWSVLTFRNKRDFFIVASFRIFNSIMGLFGLAVIIPVVEVLLDFDRAIKKPYISFFYDFVGAPEKHDFLLFLFLGSTLFLVLTMALNIITMSLSGRYFRGLNAEFMVRMLHGLVAQNMEQFYEIEQPEFMRKVNWLTSQVSEFLSTISLFVSAVMQIAFIAIILLFVNPAVFFILVFSLIMIYSVLSLKIRDIIKSLSLINRDRGRILHNKNKDIYLNFRDVLLYQSQFSEVQKIFSLKESITQSNSKIQLMNASPKMIIETLSMIAVLYYSFWYSTITNTHTVISNIVLYVIAGYRLLPAVQQVYGRWNGIHSSCVLLEPEEQYIKVMNTKSKLMRSTDFNLGSTGSFLQTENLGYVTAEGREIFSDLNINMPMRGVIQIEGRSGVGKSTLLEVLLGLRQATSGKILINAKELSQENCISLWKEVAFCSQHSKLLDDTFKKNIIFNSSECDEKMYEQAIEMAHLSSVRQRLGSDDYVIGENLGGLSGGEKQRIIIARAVYKRAGILILDEAFSAIDPQTAKNICTKLLDLDFIKVIIFTSHRPSDFEDISYSIKL